MQNAARDWGLFELPNDMTNISFLDVGSWENLMPELAMSKGATNVLGVDYVIPKRKSTAPFLQCDIFSEMFLQLPRFDIVSCSGVLYHTKDPISFLFRLKDRANKRVVVETSAYVQKLEAPEPLWYLFSADQLDNNYSNWWRPNVEGLKQALQACGYKDIKRLKSRKGNRIAFSAVPQHDVLCPKVCHTNINTIKSR